jgi:D-serine deaminase-like pyridoxal phosphate-dependent protein
VKLLLDVHHSPLAAERLRADGHDVVAASEDPELAALPDEELLRRASRSGRAVVTENASDFDRIVRTWAVTGEHHAGVVFTSPRRYHRGSSSYPENLVRALAVLLADPPNDAGDWVFWLP